MKTLLKLPLGTVEQQRQRSLLLALLSLPWVSLALLYLLPIPATLMWGVYGVLCLCQGYGFYGCG